MPDAAQPAREVLPAAGQAQQHVHIAGNVQWQACDAGQCPTRAGCSVCSSSSMPRSRMARISAGMRMRSGKTLSKRGARNAQSRSDGPHVVDRQVELREIDAQAVAVDVRRLRRERCCASLLTSARSMPRRLDQKPSQSSLPSGTSSRAQRFLPALQDRVQLVAAARRARPPRARVGGARRAAAASAPTPRARAASRLRTTTVASASRRVTRTAKSRVGLRGVPPASRPDRRVSWRGSSGVAACRSAHRSVDVNLRNRSRTG